MKQHPQTPMRLFLAKATTAVLLTLVLGVSACAADAQRGEDDGSALAERTTEVLEGRGYVTAVTESGNRLSVRDEFIERIFNEGCSKGPLPTNVGLRPCDGLPNYRWHVGIENDDSLSVEFLHTDLSQGNFVGFMLCVSRDSIWSCSTVQQ